MSSRNGGELESFQNVSGEAFGALHLPFMQSIFGMMPLGLSQWGLVAGVGSLVVVAVEIEKALLRRGERRPAEGKKAEHRRNVATGKAREASAEERT